MLCCVCGRRIYPSGKLANGRFIGPYIKLWGEVGEGGSITSQPTPLMMMLLHPKVENTVVNSENMFLTQNMKMFAFDEMFIFTDLNI